MEIPAEEMVSKDVEARITVRSRVCAAGRCCKTGGAAASLHRVDCSDGQKHLRLRCWNWWFLSVSLYPASSSKLIVLPGALTEAEKKKLSLPEV